jgi:predicted GIY-YIG superfamily endonuclease
MQRTSVKKPPLQGATMTPACAASVNFVDIPDTIQKSGGGVYLIALSKPIGNDKHRAQFYVGWAKNIYKRIKQHKNGSKHSAAFTRAAIQAGCEIHCVRVWLGETRDFERRLKRRKNHKRLVPKEVKAV